MDHQLLMHNLQYSQSVPIHTIKTSLRQKKKSGALRRTATHEKIIIIRIIITIICLSPSHHYSNTKMYMTMFIFIFKEMEELFSFSFLHFFFCLGIGRGGTSMAKPPPTLAFNHITAKTHLQWLKWFNGLDILNPLFG